MYYQVTLSKTYIHLDIQSVCTHHIRIMLRAKSKICECRVFVSINLVYPLERNKFRIVVRKEKSEQIYNPYSGNLFIKYS